MPDLATLEVGQQRGHGQPIVLVHLEDVDVRVGFLVVLLGVQGQGPVTRGGGRANGVDDEQQGLLDEIVDPQVLFVLVHAEPDTLGACCRGEQAEQGVGGLAVTGCGGILSGDRVRRFAEGLHGLGELLRARLEGDQVVLQQRGLRQCGFGVGFVLVLGRQVRFGPGVVEGGCRECDRFTDVQQLGQDGCGATEVLQDVVCGKGVVPRPALLDACRVRL